MSKILLHACCAPCSSAIVEYMMQNGMQPVIFYSNSNIYPREEYDHRLNECIRYAKKWGVEIVDDVYDHADWGLCAVGLEKEGRPMPPVLQVPPPAGGKVRGRKRI